MKLAEAIRAKRVVEVQNKEFGFKSDYAEDTNFYDYYVSMTEKRLGVESRGNWATGVHALSTLKSMIRT